MHGVPAFRESPFAPCLVPGQRAGIPPLAPGRLHEIHASGANRAAALAFALAQACGGRGCETVGTAGQAFLIRPRGGGKGRAGLHGDGLARLGLDPARLTIVEAADEAALLRAGLDAARCPALMAVVIESEGRLAAYDLTASRRLALAAERSGGRVVVLRIDAEPRPSAAFTRWTITSAPSAPLPGGAPGEPVLAARLDRLRGGMAAGAGWQLEWDSDHGLFRPLPDHPALSAPSLDTPSLPGAVVPLASLRTGADRDGRTNRAA